ncbi:MAG: CTP synthase [Candidatus Faecalibacterium intestinavium]|uniref:CTP synthase n=1 Tax=Candidatus Faecalibacterium intestinavium TaxID=2838580 RepID=A0A9E2KKC1_9FIRM|nr:CTP synthase [Candidatus Faecalibacterium intestinavium]
MATKFIFVTGGVVSGLGKGITAASLGRLLKCRGLKVASQKLDPYVNVDPGTMSPLQHGEVFVTDDGTETDLDLGHYERFTDENLNKYSNLTTGKVYWNVLNKERQGAYLGQTVQIIPHITNEIKSYIYNLASSTGADVVITEIGGTTGDIESQPFLEAIRQVGIEQGHGNCCYIHVVLVPYISGSDEYKSKPAQHSVKELQGMGIAPDIIILRADGSVGGEIRRKVSTFCNVKPECVIENLTMDSLYQCPLMLHSNGLDDVVVQKLQLDVPPADLTEWKDVVSRIASRSRTCTIALVGKYVKLHDAYLSVMESLYHAGFENDSQVEIKWVDSEELQNQADCACAFADVDGIILPGGFGDRGIEGMIQAAQYAREHNVPYFGICLGMQIMVIEFARNVLGYQDANSSEFTPEGAHNVIDLMADQQGNIPKGGTMRLGQYPCKVLPGTKMAACYGAELISERHRHRYEFNNLYRDALEGAGLVISGTSPDDRLVETVELPGRPFHLGAQFHPEFKSRPNHAHPLFKAFIAASLDNRSAAGRSPIDL